MELPAFDRNQIKQFDEPAEFLKSAVASRAFMYRPWPDAQKKCNVSYMQECLDLPQSTVSQHLQASQCGYRCYRAKWS